MESKTWPERADWQGGSRFSSLYPFMDVPATHDLSKADFASWAYLSMELLSYVLGRGLGPGLFGCSSVKFVYCNTNCFSEC